MIIGGKIIDDFGLPLPGVNIFVEANPIIGTTSDLNGEWQLSLPADAKIKFSFMGFAPQVICSREIPSIVKLQPSSTMLDNIVVTGSPKQAGMSLGQKLVVGGILASIVIAAIPGIYKDSKQGNGLKGAVTPFKKVRL